MAVQGGPDGWNEEDLDLGLEKDPEGASDGWSGDELEHAVTSPLQSVASLSSPQTPKSKAPRAGAEAMESKVGAEASAPPGPSLQVAFPVQEKSKSN